MQHSGVCNNAMTCKQWLLLAIYVPQRLSGVHYLFLSAGGYVYCPQSEWVLGNDITIHDSGRYPVKVPLWCLKTRNQCIVTVKQWQEQWRTQSMSKTLKTKKIFKRSASQLTFRQGEHCKWQLSPNSAICKHPDTSTVAAWHGSTLAKCNYSF